MDSRSFDAEHSYPGDKADRSCDAIILSLRSALVVDNTGILQGGVKPPHPDSSPEQRRPETLPRPLPPNSTPRSLSSTICKHSPYCPASTSSVLHNLQRAKPTAESCTPVSRQAGGNADIATRLPLTPVPSGLSHDDLGKGSLALITSIHLGARPHPWLPILIITRPFELDIDCS